MTPCLWIPPLYAIREQIGKVRSLYPDIKYKTHWNTVIVGSDVSDDELRRMIGMSYDLIKPKVGKHLNGTTKLNTLE